MRLDDIRAILILIKLAGYSDKPITRHAIAKNITGWSRSTTYRKINKMIDLGLVGYLPYREPNDLYVTHEGKSFLDQFIMLKGLEQSD